MGEYNGMKAIKDINKLILIKMFEIVFVIGFLFFSVTLWKDNTTQEMFSMATSFTNLNYTNMQVENPISYSMYPMEKERALSTIEPCSVIVSNDTYTEEGYMLALRVDKNSSLDYQFVNISVDEEVYSLKDLSRIDDQDNYYFILDENTLKGEQKIYKLKLWLDERTGNDMQAKQFIMSFQLLNEVTKM